MLDLSTELGSRTRKLLESEQIVWLTTVGRDGTPQPRPVWFLWDGASVLIYSRPETNKLRHIARSGRVSLNFNSDPEAEEFAVLTGEARIVSDAPRGDDNPEYLDKYRAGIAHIGMTPEGFGRDFSVAIRVTPTKMRGA